MVISSCLFLKRKGSHLFPIRKSLKVKKNDSVTLAKIHRGFARKLGVFGFVKITAKFSIWLLRRKNKSKM